MPTEINDFEREVYLRAVMIGEETSRMLTTPLGQFIINRAADQAIYALKKLQTVDPADVARITSLQNDIKVALAIPQWYKEALVFGEQNRSILELSHAEDN